MLCWPARLSCLDVGLWARQRFVGKEGGNPCHLLTGPTCGLMHFLPGLLYWSAPPVHILLFLVRPQTNVASLGLHITHPLSHLGVLRGTLFLDGSLLRAEVIFQTHDVTTRRVSA